MYKLSSWVPRTLLEVHKRLVAACISFFLVSVSHPYSIECLPAMWVLYDNLKRSKLWLLPQDIVTHSARKPIYSQQALQEKELPLVSCKDILFLHDNARPHVTQAVKDTIQRFRWESLYHSRYLSLHSPINTISAPWGKRLFTNEADLRQVFTDFFSFKTLEFCRKEIAQLATCWKKVLGANGDYFED
ncbi:hypothetical protein NPIL_291081 [Nephila pilipes]|uniref:Mariner Mos1 transposase n=1 Tax=Nephila pilipes TaxID=299642 RepID=A0A8X6Q6D1_NEPPI|nr:hypothetical protein NPIL_291081 [Nephila pilipes]